MRHIQPDMVKFLDQKLSQNGLAKQAMSDGNPRIVFRCAMESCVGIRESGGNNSGPMVELIQKTIGGASREPWCMALVQTCLAYAELKTNIKSPVAHTEHCMTCWRETPSSQRVKATPAPGAIVIWRHGTSDSGHTGMVVEAFNGLQFSTVEGNTGDSGGREGDGVYHKTRNWYADGDLKRIGWLKPF